MYNSECPAIYTEKDLKSIITVVTDTHEVEEEVHIPVIPSLRTSLIFFSIITAGLGFLLIYESIMTGFIL